MNLDYMFNRVHKGSEYDCFDFASEVWEELTSVSLINKTGELITKTTIQKFKRLEKPISPCLVLFSRKNFPTHIGVFIDGRVLHLIQHGVEYQPLEIAKRHYTKIRFYK